MGTAVLGRVLRRILRVPGRTLRREPRCVRQDVRSESGIHGAAILLRRALPEAVAAVLPTLLRDLVALNTPALFLNIVDGSGPVRVTLRPWHDRQVRLRGRGFLVEAGSEAVEGIEAFALVPFARVTSLYPTAPDHPVYVISIEHQNERGYTVDVPPYLTHVSIMVNGSLVVHGERLLHERGPQVWAAA